MPSCIVLTGATTGIGRATAPTLADRTDHLILHGLEPEREVSDLLSQVNGALRPGAELSYFSADFTELANVERLAEDIHRVTEGIDVLINNAGRPGPPALTIDEGGQELTFQTNYLAPVALTTELMDLRPKRIVNVASATHESATLDLDDLVFERHAYSPSAAYAQSKLALVTWSCWLSTHRPDRSMEVVSMHPGVIATELLHAMFSISGERPERAAANILFVALQNDDNGTYYNERNPAAPNPQATDPAIQDRLHAITDRMRVPL